jgi:hypothetical protein
LHQRNDLNQEDIATWVRPVLSGWVRYYGRFYPSKLRGELRTIDEFIVRLASRKYKTFHGRVTTSWKWLRALKRRIPSYSLTGAWNLRLDDGRRMNQEAHVQFCESAGLRCAANLKAYENVAEARQGIAAYFKF